MRQNGPLLQSGATLIRCTYDTTDKIYSRLPPICVSKQPSTIDGYRSGIADKLGNLLNVSKDENFTHLSNSFHRDSPKGQRGFHVCNLSLVLYQLIEAPFEPLEEASLKHLIKTVFLLALESGKHFLSMYQLAKKGADSVTPVVIPAMAPTLDKSLKADKSLFPIRTLGYYLQNNELVFVSFKKGFDKDISPATV